MIRRKNCAELIKQAFPDLKKGSVDAIMEEMENMRSKVFNGSEDLAGPAFREKVQNFLEQRQYQQAALRREAAENILKNQKNLNFVTQPAFEEDPVEAIKAKLGGTARYSKGGNYSVSGTTTSLMAKWHQMLWRGLETAGDGIKDIAAKGLLERETAQALWEMREGGDLSKVQSKEALATAKIYKAVNDSILKTKQLAGSAVRELNGYITKQSHDSTKIQGAGFEKWFTDTVKGLDLDRTFGPGASTEKIRGAMEEVFNDIVSGKYDKPVSEGVSDEFLTVNGRSANLSTKTARSRSLHFKDGNAWHEYNQAYGAKNLLESIVSTINQSARQSSLMEHFGTNPEGAYEALKSRIRSTYKESPDVLKSFRENESTLDQWFSQTQGYGSAPGTSMMARTGQCARAITQMARTGGAFTSSFGDLASAATALRAGNGKNLLENVSNLVSEYVSNFGNTAERRKWAGRLGIYIDDLQGSMYSKMGGDGDTLPGQLSRLQRSFAKVTLMENHIEASKVAMAKQLAMELGDHVETPFASLPDRVRLNLERYGIGEDHWKHFVRAAEDLPDGTRAVTPEGIRSIPSELFGEGGDKTKFQVETRLLTYLNDQANMAANHPGLRQRAFVLRGTEDEGVGILARLVAQFKQVPLMALDTTKRVILSNPETQPRTLRDAILNGKGDMMGFAQHLMLATALGYMGMAAKDLAVGKTPKDPAHPGTWGEAFTRGGAAGLYGDFLFGEFNRNRTVADSLIGPVLGQGADLAQLWSKARQGDRVAGDATRMLMGSIPFQNVFYTKWALDRLVTYRIQEAMSPGYARRVEARARENNQDYLFNRPTEISR